VGFRIDEDDRPVIHFNPRDRAARERPVGSVYQLSGHVLQPDLVTAHRLRRLRLAADQRLPLAVVDLVAAVHV
jgi:hypothetical protein